MSLPTLIPVTDLDDALGEDSPFDGVVLITGDLDAPVHATVDAAVQRARPLDARFAASCSLVPAPELPGARLLVRQAGPLNRDWDDVRRFAEAGGDALKRARDAGLKAPLLLLAGVPTAPEFEQAGAVTLIAALGALWQPLEAREAHGEDAMEPIQSVGYASQGDVEAVVRTAEAIEAGRRLTRDLGGTDPERMAPPRFAQAVKSAFEDTDVTVKVVRETEPLEREYPLLISVARASMEVERHLPRVVRLEYSPPGDVQRTLLFAGKGVTYDTGGADLKTDGHMAGMSRDKLGAAAVAGLFETARRLAIPGVKLVAELGLVRNSIGARAFVADEIITGHSGCRVRIGNTDAEGRLVLADLLSHLREVAVDEVQPHMFTVATLTGHAYRAVGPYTLALDNGPARQDRIAERLSTVGDLWAEGCEVSRLRPEDYDFVKARTPADDVLSSNNLPSSGTGRGHQFPMAFLVLASGLVAHGTDAQVPLRFTHIDIGGSGCAQGDWQHGAPTATPLVALTAAFLL